MCNVKVELYAISTHLKSRCCGHLRSGGDAHGRPLRCLQLPVWISKRTLLLACGLRFGLAKSQGLCRGFLSDLDVESWRGSSELLVDQLVASQFMTDYCAIIQPAKPAVNLPQLVVYLWIRDVLYGVDFSGSRSLW